MDFTPKYKLEILKRVFGNNLERIQKCSPFLNEGLSSLSDRERHIILRRFGKNITTQKIIAKDLGISTSRVQQIQARTIRKLRGWFFWNIINKNNVEIEQG